MATATKTALAAKNTTSASRAAAQVADRKAVAAKPVATKNATPKVKAPAKVVTPKTTTTAAQDFANQQAAREALRQDNIASQQTQTQAPAPIDPAAQWTLESDPLYQMALAGGQSEFNYARNAALADKQTQESAATAERKSLDTGATEARRRLAGNYAARGMAGGAAGVLSQAEARANAEQIAARTSIQNKLDALNQQFLSNYGAVGSDWTGTLAGQQYKSQAAQQALSAQLARYGSI